jgi:hypothetical protein
MRILFLFLLGVALGAIGAAITLNTLRERDAYARGTMDVLQHHYVSLRNQIAQQRCVPAASDHDKGMLRLLTDEIETAVYADATPDPPFREYSQRLGEAVAALPDANANCAALAPIVEKIGAACDACHRQYR